LARLEGMMDTDDPNTGEFASWDSFNRFTRSVRHRRRYVWTDEESAFLATVRATIHDRDVELPEGMILYRAQRGIDWDIRTDDHGNEISEEPVGYGPARMKPRVNQATEGRANPAGIPVLYLGTTEQTAISEVRPWVGASVSVAQFKILRTLRALDLSRGHGKLSIGEITFRQLFGEEPTDPETKEKAVWTDIDNAFSRPVTLSDDAADYVPTQILAELFRDAGYDAIIYKSQFAEKGFNIVLFNPDDADAINCAPYEVTALEVSFKQSGNRWSSTKHRKS
jgi:hypothetical protein